MFWIGLLTALGLVFAAPYLVGNEFYLRTGYTVLQFVVLATAWNLLGGYAGYVNFGAAAFFAVGAYTTVFLYKLFPLFQVPVWMIFLMVPAAGLVAGLLGLITGLLTLRLRGVYFSIATLALAVVMHTVVTNWRFIGGATGVSILPPREVPLAFMFHSYVEFLFVMMGCITVAALLLARYVERSWIGRGLAAIRDDEDAAECMGVPTLRLKLFAATLSGCLFGVAGAPLPYQVGYIEPMSAFSLVYAVNALAMPMIGGTATWLGPLLGALLLGSAQEAARVTISSELNLLITGALLIVFVVVAPQGLIGLLRRLRGTP
jgi:branched-chain amino acid transport system permease protein